MSYRKRTFASVVVAALVALSMAGFAGTAAAASAPGAETVQQEDGLEDSQVNVTDLEIENFSTSMELESATIMIESEDGTQEVNVESGSVELTNATVDVQNATLSDGTVELDEAMMSVEEGTIEVQSDQGDRTIDLSDEQVTVEDETVEIQDLTEQLELTEDMQDATITEMTVEGISGTAEHDLLVVNAEVSQDTQMEEEGETLSLVVQNGALDVEDTTVTVENATVEDDALVADSVQAEVGSGTFEADRVVTLMGTDLTEFTDVSQSAEDETLQASDVEVSVDDLMELLEEMMDDQAAAAIAS